MEEELRAFLVGHPAVSAVIGPRVHWIERPQGASMPAVTLSGVSREDGYTLRGPDGLVRRRVQVDCWGRSYAEAKAAERAIHEALNGHSGGIFRGIFLLSARDMRDTGEAQEGIFRASLDYEIIHEAST